MIDPDAVTRRVDIPPAGRYILDPIRSRLSLRTRLFGLRSVRAALYVVDGQIDVDAAVPSAIVTATISAASFSTDNPRRDADVRSPRFLCADKYPVLGFRGSTLRQDDGRWTLAGELTVRDVTRPATLAIDSVQRTVQGFCAHAVTRIDRAAFGLSTATWMGGRVFDVELTVAADRSNVLPLVSSASRDDGAAAT